MLIDVKLFKQLWFVVKVYLTKVMRIGVVLIIIASLLIGCNNAPVEKIVYIPIEDSTSISENIIVREQLRLTRDSLNFVRDSLGEDLFIAKYKLGRIKYYNDVAAKGNNIKYLRGWINRVLNE